MAVKTLPIHPVQAGRNLVLMIHASDALDAYAKAPEGDERDAMWQALEPWEQKVYKDVFAQIDGVMAHCYRRV